MLLNTEYRQGTVECVTLQYTDTKDDVGESLIAAGLLTIENRKEKRLAKVVASYLKAQNKAKASRVSILMLSHVIL